VIVELALIVPTELLPGDIVALRATAVTADGTTLDVTSRVEWSVAPGSAATLTVSPGGLASGLSPGEAVVMARYAGLVAQAALRVRPTDSALAGLAGDYTLRLEAETCQGSFPDAALRRVYAARLDPIGSRLQVALSGADIWRGSGVFTGVVTAPETYRFIIRPEWAWDYDAFDLIETLPGGTSVIVQGTILARRTAEGIAGRRDPAPDAGNALHIRLNSAFGGWCPIEIFELKPRSDTP
jgi:hypothetical protein